MHRTTIMLPADLRRRAQLKAKEEGVSLAELIRTSLEERLRKDRKKRVSFFDDKAVFRGETPPDLALDHDKYLYGS